MFTESPLAKSLNEIGASQLGSSPSRFVTVQDFHPLIGVFLSSPTGLYVSLAFDNSPT